MGVRQPSSGASNNVGATIGFNTEFAILTLPPLSGPISEAVIQLSWYVVVGQGSAGATGVIVRLRRGSGLTGTIINNPQTIPGGPATSVLCSGCWVDSPGVVASLQYTLSVQTVGNSGTSPNFQEAAFFAFIM